MKLIDEYMKLSKNERQLHLKLEEPCIERNCDSHECRGLLAHILDTSVPKGRSIAVCHACGNSRCNNPFHLYWGTYKENYHDSVAFGRAVGVFASSVAKYGYAGFLRKALKNSKKASEAAAKKRLGTKSGPHSEGHRKKISASIKQWHADRRSLLTK